LGISCTFNIADVNDNFFATVSVNGRPATPKYSLLLSYIKNSKTTLASYYCNILPDGKIRQNYTASLPKDSQLQALFFYEV